MIKYYFKSAPREHLKMSCFNPVEGCFTMFSKDLNFLSKCLELHIVKKYNSKVTVVAYKRTLTCLNKVKIRQNAKKLTRNNETVYHQGCFLYSI